MELLKFGASITAVDENGHNSMHIAGNITLTFGFLAELEIKCKIPMRSNDCHLLSAMCGHSDCLGEIIKHIASSKDLDIVDYGGR